MTFNQQLIEKARKGEIAILNDGSVEELRFVLNQVSSSMTEYIKDFIYRYYWIDSACKRCTTIYWSASNIISFPIPAHSVKDFFMTEPIPLKEILDDIKIVQPRTYKVTRQQMKEIHDSMDEEYRDMFLTNLHLRFDPFVNESFLNHDDVSSLCQPAPKEVLKKIFPAYFYVPEGEPVLVRDHIEDNWEIRISDGNGGVYIDSLTFGKSRPWNYIIPFTKNPPK